MNLNNQLIHMNRTGWLVVCFPSLQNHGKETEEFKEVRRERRAEIRAVGQRKKSGSSERIKALSRGYFDKSLETSAPY